MKIKLKTAVSAVLCVCCLITFLTVFAAEEKDYSVTASSGFTVAYGDSDMRPVADIMKVDAEELSTYCKENNVKFIAVNSDNTVQIRLSRYQTSLSEKMKDMSYQSDELIDELASDFGSGYVKTVIGDNVFIKMTETLEDGVGEYTTEQYVTVKNGYVYQISVYISEGADPSAAQAFIEGITINSPETFSTKQKILVGSAIAVLLILIGLMVRGIVKDIRSEQKKQTEEQKSQEKEQTDDPQSNG